MSRHALLSPAKGWDISLLPIAYSQMQKTTTDSMFYSQFHDLAKKRVTAHAYIVQAMICWLGGDESPISLVKVADMCYAVETELDSGETLIFQLMPNGQCQGGLISTTGRISPLPTIGGKNDEFNTTAIFLALMGQIEEAHGSFSSLGNTPEQIMYTASDIVVSVLESDLLKVLIPGGNVSLLTQMALDSGALTGTVLLGHPKILNRSLGSGGNGVIPFWQAMAEFAEWRAGNTWTTEEEELIPTFPDDFPVLPEAMKICRRYVGSAKDKRPMQNFMWRGVTSYGKSTGVEQIAAMLHVPLLRMTCHSTMESQDFLSCIVPVSDHAADVSLPSFEEISLDPESAYALITGQEKENVTSEECLRAYAEAYAAKSSHGNTQFKHVASNFVRALERGYLLEIQECSRIKDPGVLVSLNEYDRAGARIPLVDGSFVRRHEKAMVVWTDNVGYSSCRAIDPSVLRRMAFILDSYEVDEETALSRVVYNTGFDRPDVLKKLYSVWNEIRVFCADRDITEGSISLTELERWAQIVMADGYANLFESCKECVVAKATSVPEEQADIVSSVLSVHLP